MGEISVHSFTESGFAMNMLIGIFALVIPLIMLTLFFRNNYKFPFIEKEEDISSREFWMFIGSLIFFLAAMYIIAITSVPVYNKVFHTSIADPVDREFAYNKVLILVAVVITLLTAVIQYFKYKSTPRTYINWKLGAPLFLAILITAALAVYYPVKYVRQGIGFEIAIYLALFVCIFSAIANAGYIFTVLKGNIKAAGSAIAHTGFAIMVIGMLISAGNKEVISDNRKTGLYMPFDKDPSGRSTEDPMENLTLLKNVPTQMGSYRVTYLSDSPSLEKNRSFYKLGAEKINSNGTAGEKFVLEPDVYKMKNNNLSSNPDIKHYLTHDVFTYISSLPDKNMLHDTAQFKIHELKIKDTLFLNKGYLVLNNIMKNPDISNIHFKSTDTALVADITVFNKDSTSHKSYPYLFVKSLQLNFKDDTVYSANVITRLNGITNDQKFKIAVKETELPLDFITLKAYVFPYINLVWAGLIIMALGFMISIIKRINNTSKIAYLLIFMVCAGLIYMFFLSN